jgi:hypothetical protein
MGGERDMSEFRVADLCVGQPDAVGNIVVEMFYRVSRTYAVYRTDDRVMIQFADSDSDDPQLGANQRKSMTDLLVMRGEIDSLLSELGESGERDRAARNLARRAQRRLADALMIALTGGTNQASQELSAIRTLLVDDRASRTRIGYLGWAGASGIAILAGVALLGTLFPNDAGTQKSLCFSAGVGVVGALFSIAIAIRGRSIDTTHPKLDIFVDAALRVLVGALSGALLYALIGSGAFGLSIGGTEIHKGDNFVSTGKDWLLVLLTGFIAGFSQQIVPDLLARATAIDGDPKPAMTSAAAASDAASSEANPTGTAGTANAPAGPSPPPPPPPPDADQEADDCCDRPGGDEVVTPDTELPEAIGGVEGQGINGKANGGSDR